MNPEGQKRIDKLTEELRQMQEENFMDGHCSRVYNAVPFQWDGCCCCHDTDPNDQYPKLDLTVPKAFYLDHKDTFVGWVRAMAQDTMVVRVRLHEFKYVRCKYSSKVIPRLNQIDDFFSGYQILVQH